MRHRSKCRATTNPSPALFPLPQAMATGPCTPNRTRTSAHPRPAFSISTRPLMPNSSIARRSTWRTCDLVNAAAISAIHDKARHGKNECIVTVFVPERNDAMSHEPREVYRADSTHQAYLLLDFLADNGIKASVVNDALQIADLPPGWPSLPRVMVPVEQE